MSFYLSYARFCSYVMNFLMHTFLIALFSLSFTIGSGGPSEVACLSIHLIAVLFLIMYAVYLVMTRGSEPSNRVNTLCAGVLFFVSFLGSAVISGRTAHAPGLAWDYFPLSNAYMVAVTVLALSWATTVMALLALAAAYLDKYPGAVQVSHPTRHRVVFHKNSVPLKEITIDYMTPPPSRKSSRSGPRHEGAPRLLRPEPTFSKEYWMNRPMRPMRTTCDSSSTLHAQL